MRKQKLCVTLTEDSHNFITMVAEEIGSNKSAAVDLIIDAASGNLGTLMVKHHYDNGFERQDGRKGKVGE